MKFTLKMAQTRGFARTMVSAAEVTSEVVALRCRIFVSTSQGAGGFMSRQSGRKLNFYENASSQRNLISSPPKRRSASSQTGKTSFNLSAPEAQPPKERRAWLPTFTRRLAYKSGANRIALNRVQADTINLTSGSRRP